VSLPSTLVLANFIDGMAYGPPTLSNNLHQSIYRQALVTMSSQS
jgi:hypothetical protein